MSNENDIAIVGMAAHLPGAGSIGEFWSNLRGGVESIRRLTEPELAAAGETPDRLHHRDYVPAAATLDGFERFDGEFFGFSPKEAAIMDPQHRQFLEVAWEALEDAGLVAGPLAGSRTGVFVGIYADDYWDLQQLDRASIDAYTNSGGGLCMAANRISHAFDFRGPSLAVDTACSSALAAIHLACQSIWDGESDLALAGGVHLMLRAETSVSFCKAAMLSPTGRCWAFDARAAQPTAVSSSATSITQKPPRYSGASTNGPLTALSDSPVLSTVIALEGGISPPAKTRAPVDVSSSMIAPVAAMAASSSAGSIVSMVGYSSESCGTDSRYWLMPCTTVLDAGTHRPSHRAPCRRRWVTPAAVAMSLTPALCSKCHREGS